MTLTVGNKNLGFLINRSIPIPYLWPFILLDPSMNVHINVDTNPSMDIEPQPKSMVPTPPVIFV